MRQDNTSGGVRVSGAEHAEMMEVFERAYKGRGRMDREEKALWTSVGRVYQYGDVNDAFLAFRDGYALAKSIYQE